MKGAVSRIGDKLGISDRARAPQDDGEYNDLVGRLASTSKALKDLEVRATLLNGSANKMAGDNEKLALQEAALFGPLGVGRNGDFAGLRECKERHAVRYGRVQEQLKHHQDVCKALQASVDERHRLGADHEKLKKKAGGSTPTTPRGAGEAGQGEEEELGFDATGQVRFEIAHDKSLSELRMWAAALPSELLPLYHALREMQLGLAGHDIPPPPSSSISSWTAPIASLKLW